METSIKSSFIPSSPIMPQKQGARHTSRGFDVFILLSLVLLVASATLAIGVFLYAQYLSTSATSKLAQLQKAQDAFEPSLIQDLSRLDDRMRAADTILAGHTAPTVLFHLLEKLTLQTVAFTSFDFSSTHDVHSLTMKGVARSVNSVALQADFLSKSGIISNPIFSNINRQAGGVNFDFTANINQIALAYSAAAVKSGAIVPKVEQPQSTSPFGTPGETQGPLKP